MTTPIRSRAPDTHRIRPKPFTLVMLPDVEGGQPGLLPKSTQGNPLKIEFDPWGDSDPTPEDPENVVLWWNGVPEFIKEWTAPIATGDYFIDVDPEYLTPGTHKVSYVLTLRNQQKEPSEDLELTVDVEPPQLNADSALKFDTDLIDFDYLNAHGDVVEGKVPLSPKQAPGDVAIGYWENPDDGSYMEARSEPLTHLNYTAPITLTFTGDDIRLVGDGQRQVTYQIQDRALNLSAFSDPALLQVAAIRAPHYAPFPWLEELPGDPSNWGQLDPTKTLRGATGLIPDEAVYYDEDRLTLLFGEPGTPGAVRLPVVPGSRNVQIAKETIASFLGKTLSVSYDITLPDDSTHPSDPLTLVVQPIPQGNFRAPQLSPPHSDPTYKSAITAAGLPVLQAIWPYISTQCLITITVTGTGTDNQAKTETILAPRAVTLPETTAGVAAAVSQAFMRNLKSGTRYIVLTKVSFDNGGKWFEFNELRPMILD
ncbi:hypothetical protein ACYZT4_05425 [Pseudomonas sp. GB2N2]